MDRFQAIRAFREVAAKGGFAAAARTLNSSPPTVSRLVSELERDLGVRLFTRTTRTVSLTEEGEEFLLKGGALIDELAALSDEIRARQQVPTGRLRISSVVAFGQERIAPMLPAFMEKYPKVSVELDLSNRMVDLVQDHVDLAIRVGGPDGLDASALMARKISTQKLIFVATPGYVARYGAPHDLDALERHCVVKHISGTWGRENALWRNGEVRTYSLPETFIVNSPNAACNAILTGGALGLLGDHFAADLISDGRLVQVLPDFETLAQPIYAVFVHRTYMPAKIRAFIDHLIEALGPPISV
jgi:DNA-binding transcriptional LysR family regulator